MSNDNIGRDKLRAFAENLIAAKALLDTPEKWDSMGIIGAINSVAGSGSASYFDVRKALMKELDRGRATSLIMFNSARQTKHKDIMGLFDRAIAAQDAAK